jgi:glutamate receptor ionotropic, NMDA 1
VLFKGATGKVAFDDNGDRMFAEYDIVNVQEDQRQASVGKYFFNQVFLTSTAKRLYNKI